MTDRIFRVDVQICGTAYIKASSPEVAELILNSHHLEEATELIDGSRFGDPKLPKFSISPAMTLYGKFQPSTQLEDITDGG